MSRESPFTGTRDHSDIRTWYTSELAYLKDVRRRYACAYCGTATQLCGSCRRANERIEELEREFWSNAGAAEADGT